MRVSWNLGRLVRLVGGRRGADVLRLACLSAACVVTVNQSVSQPSRRVGLGGRVETSRVPRLHVEQLNMVVWAGST